VDAKIIEPCSHTRRTALSATRSVEVFRLSSAQPGKLPVVLLLGLAGAIEIVGSLLLLVGFFSRPAAFIMSGEMAVAYFMVRPPRGFFPLVNGGNLEVMYCLMFFTFFLIGGGEWSVDHQRRRHNGFEPSTGVTRGFNSIRNHGRAEAPEQQSHDLTSSPTA
jgi:putative oxidoreductase